MYEDLIRINKTLGKQNEILEKKLSIAKQGLKAIISNNSDTLNIAEKTLQEIKNCELPQEDPQTEDQFRRPNLWYRGQQHQGLNFLSSLKKVYPVALKN